MFCHNCGTQYEGKFCPNCGEKSIVESEFISKDEKEERFSSGEEKIRIKKSIRGRIFAGIIIVIGVLFGGAYLLGYGDEPQLTPNYVEEVKQGHPIEYPNMTYEEAFNNFFSNPSWEYFVGTKEGPDEDGDGVADYTEDNLDIVEFTGGCLYQDTDVEALIQFTLSKDNDTFEATYLSFNDVPQSNFMLYALLEAVFSDESLDKHLGEENYDDNDEYPYLEQFISYLQKADPNAKLNQDEYKAEYKLWESGEAYLDLYIDNAGTMQSRYDDAEQSEENQTESDWNYYGTYISQDGNYYAEIGYASGDDIDYISVYTEESMTNLVLYSGITYVRPIVDGEELLGDASLSGGVIYMGTDASIVLDIVSNGFRLRGEDIGDEIYFELKNRIDLSQVG